MDNFYPTRNPAFDPISGHRVHIEFLKAAFEADVSGVEKCLGKCNVSFRDTSNGDNEGSCLKKCYTRFFDSKLLVQKEITKHSFGLGTQ